VNYPNVTIKIRNFIPTLELQQQDEQTKEVKTNTMFKLSTGIDALLMQVADAAGFAYEDTTDILDLARTGEEDAIEFTGIDYAAEDWSADYIAKQAHATVAEYNQNPQYADIAEITSEVAAALKEFWQANLLASVLEEVYALLIAKAVFTASELGIGTIVLDDDQHEIRLMEKAGKEMGAVSEIDLIVI
jgi:hypothetical protein